MSAKPKVDPELASLIPPLSSKEKEALKVSIREEGVRDRIAVAEDGTVLDGHHRFAIAGKEAPTRTVKGLTAAERKAYVYQANFLRRNLSSDQRRELLKSMKAIAFELRAEDTRKNTQARVAKALGVARETVRNWFGPNGQKAKGAKPPKPDARITVTSGGREQIARRRKKGEKIEQVAADYGIHPRTVDKIAKAEKVKKERESRVFKYVATKKIPPCGVVLADPPWRYEYSSTESRKVENQYPTMTAGELHAMAADVHKKCMADVTAYVWATAPKLEEALALLAAWGFSYRTCAVWNKETIGMGYYFRQQTELLLVGVRGRPTVPAAKDRVSSLFEEPRRKHSQKPECVYAWIEQTYKSVPKLELFQRTPRKGWYSWGCD